MQGILRAPLGSELPDVDPSALDVADLDLATLYLAVLDPLGAGRTGAALAGMVAQARAIARREDRALRFDDLVRAMATTHQRSEAVLRRLAVHGAGHAIAALRLGMRLERASTIAAAISGGSNSGFVR